MSERGVERNSGVFFGLYAQVNGRYWQVAGVRFLVYCLIWFAYFIVMEAAIGATVGKLATGIRVARPDGSEIGWSESFVRNAFRIVDGIPFVLPYLLGAIVIWSGGPEKRRVGDRVGKTRVVTRRSVGDGMGPAIDDAIGPRRPAGSRRCRRRRRRADLPAGVGGHAGLLGRAHRADPVADRLAGAQPQVEARARARLHGRRPRRCPSRTR